MGKKRGCGAPKRRPQPSLFISMTRRLPPVRATGNK